MEQHQNLYRVALTMVNGVGDILARRLLDFFHGDAELIFRENPRSLAQVDGIGTTIANAILQPDPLRRAEKELEFVQKNDIRIYFLSDPDYPTRLRECGDAPILFYCQGAVNFNACKHIVSVVGTRSATPYGQELTDTFIRDLTDAAPGTLVVSGLAYGIDILAHRAALRHKLPTLAVLAHGLDRIYPPTHRSTAIEMLDQGGLLSEFPHLTSPDKPNFVRRNRIVAGLSEALIVIEAPHHSGALITADIAFSYGRDIFAFPGRTTDTKSVGTNLLIHTNKAALLFSAYDLITALRWDLSTDPLPPLQQPSIPFSFTENTDAIRLLDIIRNQGEVHINLLAHLSLLPVHQLSPLLCDLQVENLIVSLPGGIYRAVHN